MKKRLQVAAAAACAPAGAAELHAVTLSHLTGGICAQFSSNPGIRGGSCFGDSGEPFFYGTSNLVVSVVNWGRTPCIGVDYQFRVDAPVAQDFLNQ